MDSNADISKPHDFIGMKFIAHYIHTKLLSVKLFVPKIHPELKFNSEFLLHCFLGYYVCNADFK